MSISLQDCREQDSADPLARYRDAFALPERIIYLDGNSLGALPKQAEERVRTVMTQQWGRDLIKSWNLHDWIGAPQRVGAKIARLIGAKPNEVVVTDSTSLNVFKALHAALRLRPDRRVILSDEGNFPTDLYMAQGLTQMLGAAYELKIVSPDRIPAELTDEVAVLMLTEVDYRTGRLHDMAGLTARAHEAGVPTIWDLAHSAGALPVDLTAADADFAVGCTYKYLNGGPGGPAFLFVAAHRREELVSPIRGWFGQRHQFAMERAYDPDPSIRRFLAGTRSSVNVTSEALRAKARGASPYPASLHSARTSPSGLLLSTKSGSKLRRRIIRSCANWLRSTRRRSSSSAPRHCSIASRLPK